MIKFYITLVVADPLSSIEVETMLQKIENVNLTIFRNSDSCKEYLNTTATLPHLIIIDLNLGGVLNGLKLAEDIQDLSTPLVLLTSQENEEHYDRIKALKPIAFIRKPFLDLSLQTVIDSVRNTLNSTDNKGRRATDNSIFLRQNNQFIRLYFKDILWIKSDGNYCLIKTENRRFIIKKSLVKFYQELPKNKFIQIHRRYVVQFSVIDRVDIQTNLAYVGKEEISIGGKFKAALVKRLKGQ